MEAPPGGAPPCECSVLRRGAVAHEQIAVRRARSLPRAAIPKAAGPEQTPACVESGWADSPAAPNVELLRTGTHRNGASGPAWAWALPARACPSYDDGRHHKG